MGRLIIFKRDNVMYLSKRTRLVFFIVCVSLLLVISVINFAYRPYIYENGIYHFYFADTFTNIWGVPIATCLGMALTQKLVYKEIYYSMAVCLGLICYEVIGLTFDYKDIIATFIGALLSYAINKMVIRYSC